MNNIIKMLSVNKDYRMVIADTSQIAERELMQYTGEECFRNLLEQLITNCTLMVALNDFNYKTSITLRLANHITILCMIVNARFSMEYSEGLNEQTGSVAGLFHNKAILSVTTGDWETGLHTGTVEAYIDDISMLFSHFMGQSEQLPSHFITVEGNNSRGLLVQPLPFADEKLMAKNDAEIVYLTRDLASTNWDDASDKYAHLASVVSQSTME